MKTPIKTDEILNYLFKYCKSEDDEPIGIIRYYPIWRHYCYFPDTDTVYSDRCQIGIGFFVLRLNEELKKKWEKD
jgi:hypothetical protein